MSDYCICSSFNALPYQLIIILPLKVILPAVWKECVHCVIFREKLCAWPSEENMAWLKRKAIIWKSSAFVLQDLHFSQLYNFMQNKHQQNHRNSWNINGNCRHNNVIHGLHSGWTLKKGMTVTVCWCMDSNFQGLLLAS